MSFEQQECVLFELLFDHARREQFCADQTKALSHYDLSPAERDDFKTVCPEALRLDATMRANFILSHLCKSFPISFSITASLTNGLATLKQLIDTTTMRGKLLKRAILFGNRLHEHYANFLFSSDNERAIAVAILKVELGMNWISANLKQTILTNGSVPAPKTALPEDWLKRPIKLAAYVSVGIIPQPYEQLKKAFCTAAEGELWRHLNNAPVSSTLRKSILECEEPRLFVARAYASRISRCEPAIDYKTIQLSEGFVPLFQHVNGTMSITQILEQLQQIGTPEQILQPIQFGFRQLLETGMLELA